MSKDLKDKMITGFKKALELTKKADSLTNYNEGDYGVEVSFVEDAEQFNLEITPTNESGGKEFTYSLSFGEVKVDLSKKEYEKLVEKFNETNKVFEDKKTKKVIEKLEEIINL